MLDYTNNASSGERSTFLFARRGESGEILAILHSCLSPPHPPLDTIVQIEKEREREYEGMSRVVCMCMYVEGF